MHHLKIICVSSWLALIGFQVALPWLQQNAWLALLVLPLLVPCKGLLVDKRYTYKWIGFLTLPYFCIGISELVSNPELRIYGFGTTIASTLLFLGSIYYVRYLGVKREV